jgi:hypothetical protein
MELIKSLTKRNQNWHLIFFLNSTHHREATQKILIFLELKLFYYEINKFHNYLNISENRKVFFSLLCHRHAGPSGQPLLPR